MGEQAYEPVQVELGGEMRTLRLTLRAVRLIKQHAGADAFDGTVNPADMVDRVGVFLWAMIGDPKLTVEQVEDMVEIRDVDRITEALGRVFSVDMPADAAGGNGGPPEGKAHAST
jgi:hypothetical protein